MSALVTWLVAAMLAFAPPANARKFPGWEETPDEARARYTLLARAIEEAVLASNGSGYSDKAEAALLLALALKESDLARDVDVGPCYRVGAWKKRCDGGTSFSVWQLKAYRTSDGTRVTGAMIQADRTLAAKKALALALGSLGQCKKLPESDRLSAYVRGTCQEGHQGSAERVAKWRAVEAWKAKP